MSPLLQQRIAPMANYEIPQRLARPATRARPAGRLHASSALAAGLISGGVLLLMLLAFSWVIYGEPPVKLLRMIAATIYGPDALSAAGDFDPALALLGATMHFAFAMLYALALVGVLVEMRTSLAPIVGLAYGVALYFVNLHLFTLLFPWFAELRTVDTLVAHAFFGLLIAQVYAALTAGEPQE